MKTLEKVTVRVPATTANLGPGFDCLGMALNIWNEVMVEKGPSFGISVSGEGAGAISRGKDNRVYQGTIALYERTGGSVPDLFISCKNDIPLARGLGSSAAAAVSGLLAANLLSGEPLPPEELLQLGIQLEGHADNLAAALFGGCQVVTLDNGQAIHAPIPLPPELKAVLFIPDFEMPTQESRNILPPEVSRSDAVHNLGRVSLLVAALVTNQLDHLRLATQDRLHQPARQSLFPAMGSLLEAALEVGALGAFLSGGGSTIIALTQGEGKAIEEAMMSTARKAGVAGKTRISRLSQKGAHRR
jgi:homoserine kinase